MKKSLQFLAQRILGFKNYLFLFSIFKIITLRYDKKEADFFVFLKLLKPKATVIDIGANIGIMTYFLSKNKHRVYAFEPIPENIKTIERIIRFFKFKDIKLCPLALSNVTEEITMQMPIESSVRMQGLSHVVDNISQNSATIDSFTYQVKSVPLDDISDLQSIVVNAIKMDVENFEFQVLLGAKKLISRCKPLIYIELWDNQNRIDCFAFAKELNYSIQVAHENSLVDFDAQVHDTQNFFFVPSRT